MKKKELKDKFVEPKLKLIDTIVSLGCSCGKKHGAGA